MFQGGNSEAAENFIQAVEARARLLGKQDNKIWTARFAGTRLSGNMEIWYQDLDIKTQNDWELLKDAIKAQYDPPKLPDRFSMRRGLFDYSRSSLSKSTPETQSTRADPRSFSIPQMGRIVVKSDYPELCGYLSNNTSGLQSQCTLTKDLSYAAVLEMDVASRTIRFQSDETSLAAQFGPKTGILGPGMT
ncbi:hypothetical protein FRC01_004116, partial [Tulasnella sp. 417]